MLPVVVAARQTLASASPYLALVTNGADGTVSAVDVESGTVVQTIIVGAAQGSQYAPGCIAISPDESLALVTYEREGAQRVIALDVTAIADGVEDNEIIETIDLQQDLLMLKGANCIAITPDGARAYVGDGWNSAGIAVIDLATIDDGLPNNEVTWLSTGYATYNSIVITPDGSRAYVTDDGYADAVHVLDTDPASATYHQLVGQIYLGSANTFARGIAITSDGARAYVADWSFDQVYVIDTDPASPDYHTLLTEINLDPEGSGAFRVAVSPDGTRGYVTRAGEVQVIDTDPASPTYHTVVNTLSGIPAGEGGLTVTPDGETLLVVGKYNDSLSIIDLSTGVEVGRVPVGQNPEGVVVYHAPVPENHVKVVDEAGGPLKGAVVYHNGLPIGATDERGLAVPQDMQLGDTFAAILMTHEQPTVRANHQTPDSSQDWAYRVHITNLDQDGDGNPIPHVVTGLGQQVITLYASRPLVLFNLVVSVEWDATEAYLAEIAGAMRFASDYLYDLTDGQMAFGQAAIYDQGTNWAEADIQISAKNIVRPHAYVGGIIADDRSHVIRLGRGWDGVSGDQGPWDRPDGFRTLAHEFGHYGLHLYDEYFAYTFDQNGKLTGEVPAICTGPENRNPATDATNASTMDYQYTSSELSARGVPSLWSGLCEQTAQWQLTGESTWDTFTRMYADTGNSPRWQFSTPLDRGGVLAGPNGLPADVLALPIVTISNGGPSGPSRHLTVYDPAGEPYWGALVALYKQDGRVLGQGFTDGDGQLDIYGADEGDMLRAASIDGGLAGSVEVGPETDLSLALAPVAGLATQAVAGIPHMRVIAEPGLNPNQIDLLVSLQNFGAGADPTLNVTEPGDKAGHSPPLVPYNPTTGAYEVTISFSATERGMGRIRTTGAVGNSLVRLQSTYRLQRVLNTQDHDVYSDDGNLHLRLKAGGLPGDEAYFVVMPPGAAPGTLPLGLLLVGDPYDITASGALVTLAEPAILEMGYDGALVNPSLTPEDLAIYRWDANNQAWQKIGGDLDEAQKLMSTLVTALGTYALMASPGPWTEPPQEVIFLPLIVKDKP